MPGRHKLARTAIRDQDDKGLHFVEEPIEVMDRDVKKLKQSKIPIIKVCWNSRQGPEFTWELEDKMKRKFSLKAHRPSLKIHPLEVC
ncbi:hypothetical protein Tco_0742446 [Tanacetum coccineum]